MLYLQNWFHNSSQNLNGKTYSTHSLSHLLLVCLFIYNVLICGQTSQQLNTLLRLSVILKIQRNFKNDKNKYWLTCYYSSKIVGLGLKFLKFSCRICLNYMFITEVTGKGGALPDYIILRGVHYFFGPRGWQNIRNTKISSTVKHHRIKTS